MVSLAYLGRRSQYGRRGLTPRARSTRMASGRDTQELFGERSAPMRRMQLSSALLALTVLASSAFGANHNRGGCASCERSSGYGAPACAGPIGYNLRPAAANARPRRATMPGPGTARRRPTGRRSGPASARQSRSAAPRSAIRTCRHLRPSTACRPSGRSPRRPSPRPTAYSRFPSRRPSSRGPATTRPTRRWTSRFPTKPCGAGSRRWYGSRPVSDRRTEHCSVPVTPSAPSPPHGGQQNGGADTEQCQGRRLGHLDGHGGQRGVGRTAGMDWSSPYSN